MELRHLEHFVAVADERHFTRAAKRAHVAQSALSASIRAFERELGAPLFARSTRRVELTDAGRALLPEARRTLAAADTARAAVGAVQGLLRGSVSVGTGKALAFDLVPVLARFCAEYPGISLNLHQAGSLELIDAVRGGRLDFAPVGLPGHELPGLRTIMLHTEAMVLACSAEHRLAERQRVRLADIAEEAFVDFHADWGVRFVTDRWFGDAGLERRVAFAVNDVDMLLDLVENGFGVAVIPGNVGRRRKAIRFVRLSKAPPWEVGLVVPSDRPPSFAAQRLLDMVLAAARENGRP
jgi:DNA-binding transcriptional LysR family regulator